MKRRVINLRRATSPKKEEKWLIFFWRKNYASPRTEGSPISSLLERCKRLRTEGLMPQFLQRNPPPPTSFSAKR